METNVNQNVDTQQQEKNEVVEEVKTYTQEELDKAIAEATKDLLSKDKVNEIVQQRLDKEKNKAEEAKRLAEMSAEERARAEFEIEMKAKQDEYKAQLDEFNKMKGEFEAQQLLMETQKQLNDRGLPISMAQLLCGATAEETLKNIEMYEKQYKEDLEKEVNKRLKSSTTPTVPKSVGTVDKNPKDMNFAEYQEWKKNQ